MSDALPGWKERKLGDLGRYINGRAFKPADWGSKGLPIIRIQNLTDPKKEYNFFDGPVSERHLVRDGDLLISWSATLGSFIWDRGDAALNQHIFKVDVNEALVEKEFLHYLVLHILEDLASQTHGSTMKHITKGKFDATPVLIPPLAEQRRLVGRIRACLDRIDAVRRLRAESVAAAESLFSSALKEIAESVPAAPVPLGDVLVDTMNGLSLRATPSDANGRVLSLGALRTLYLDAGESKPVVMDDHVAEKYAVEPGDVFISRSNTRELVGLPAIARGDWGRVIFPDLMIRLVPDERRIRPVYLALALRLPDVREAVRSHAKGTSSSMVKISGRSLRLVEIPVPSLADQHRVETQALAAYDLAQDLRRYQREQAAQEAALTQSVLARAFAGDL